MNVQEGKDLPVYLKKSLNASRASEHAIIL